MNIELNSVTVAVFIFCLVVQFVVIVCLHAAAKVERQSAMFWRRAYEKRVFSLSVAARDVTDNLVPMTHVAYDRIERLKGAINADQ